MKKIYTILVTVFLLFTNHNKIFSNIPIVNLRPQKREISSKITQDFNCCIKRFTDQYNIVFLKLKKAKVNYVEFDELKKRIKVKDHKRVYKGKEIDKFFDFILIDENMNTYKVNDTENDFLIIKSRKAGATKANTLLNSYLLINLKNGNTKIFDSLGNQNNIIYHDSRNNSISFFEFTFSEKFYKKGLISIHIKKVDLLKETSSIIENFYEFCECK